jgi:hypothetical protein
VAIDAAPLKGGLRKNRSSSNGSARVKLDRHEGRQADQGDGEEADDRR